MSYEQLRVALAAVGFFTHYREDNDTLICTSEEWPNVPQRAHSFWVARRSDGWYLGTWAPRLYRIADASRIPALCIAWLRRYSTRAQWEVDENTQREFQLSEIGAEDLPAE